jgi:heme-degrading monooxygenase HmoA
MRARKENWMQSVGFLAVFRADCIANAMDATRKGQIAVIFASQRTTADPQGYHDAADAMEALAQTQPGYAGIDSARGGDGFGITVSYWTDDDAAKAWRDHPEHIAIRNRGRAVWYVSYTISVARVERGYDWARHG